MALLGKTLNNLLIMVSIALQAASITFPLPATNYPVPTGAIFVSMGGSDTNAGTAAAPLRTPAAALSKVTSGGTIVFRGGSYYNVALGSIRKKITMQPYPNEQVWIKGSVQVTGWVVDGTIWKKTDWTTKFCHTCFQPEAIDTTNFPNAGLPDQVFVASNALTQVTSKAAVTTGKFFVDYTNNVLYIGTNPTGQLVEASVAWKALIFDAGSEGSIVRGLGFSQYAPHWDESQLAAVISNAASVTFESCAFVQSAGTSLGMFQPDNIVRNSYIGYNGYRGVVGNRCHQCKVEDNTVDYNNVERFDTDSCGMYCTVAGIKFAHSDDLVIKNNYFRNNYGHGFWCDLGCTDAAITRNVASGNLGHGMYYEVSARAIVASNIFSKNGRCGLKISGSPSVRVYNNVFNRNAPNLGVYDDGRSSSSDDYSSSLNLVWDTRYTEIRNNLFSNTNGASVFYDSNIQQVNSQQMISAMDHNGWYRSSVTAPATMIKWCPTTTCANHATHAAFTQATGLDAVPPSIVVDNVATNPFFVNEAVGDFNLLASSSAQNAGVTLPADIASVLGVSASPVDMGALVWRGQAAGPQALTFIATDDATIQQGMPTTNFGADTQLIADADPRTDFLMKFTVSGVGTRTVTKATLQIYAVDPGKDGAEVYQANHNTWNQGSVTWNTAPWIVSPALGILPEIVASTTYSVDVTALVKADGVFGFRVIQPSIEGIRFSSLEGIVKPKLVLNVQ